jgi:hypothetical protein
VEVREKYQIKMSNRFATVENRTDGEDINTAWENIKESIKITVVSYVQTSRLCTQFSSHILVLHVPSILSSLI